MANKLEKLIFVDHGNFVSEHKDYARLQDAAISETLSRRECRKAKARLREADAEQNDIEFLERYMSECSIFTGATADLL